MSSKNDDQIIQDLIAGGLIGAGLVALLSKKKDPSDEIALGALAGAAILASYKANENAKKANLPVYVKKGNSIYEEYPDGTQKLIKELPLNKIPIQKKFNLT